MNSLLFLRRSDAVHIRKSHDKRMEDILSYVGAGEGESPLPPRRSRAGGRGLPGLQLQDLGSKRLYCAGA